MNFAYKFFKKHPDSREDIITMTSLLGLFANVIISVTKIAIGLLVSSIAIVSEGAHNAADALSSMLTFVGSKLAKKRPDKQHPFGYGRIEYLVSLIISVLILFTGFEILKSSVNLIVHPEGMTVSYTVLAILFVSAVIKFFLGVYTVKMGKKADSSALVGVGVEGRSDAFASVVTIASTLVYIVFGLSLDAYAGVVVSLFILKAGWGIVRQTVGDLLGRPGEVELANLLYKQIRAEPGIVSAADMMLHNYGPDKWSGSVNVEIDHAKTVGEVYAFLHNLQLKIMHEHKVTMVFGVYAVDNDNAASKKLRAHISDFVRKQAHVVSYHAVYIDEINRTIYCDFIVDYELKDWDMLQQSFTAYMHGLYPDYSVELTVETEFV